MSNRYGYWSPRKASDGADLHERAFRRQGLADWDARWHELTPEARSAFVKNIVKGPARNQADHAPTYTVPVDRFPPRVLEELTAAGFIKVQPGQSRSSAGRAFPPAVLYDFAARIRMLNRLHLLDADRPSELQRYADQAFDGYLLRKLISEVIRSAGMADDSRMDVILERYVKSHRWPGWIVRRLKDPLAQRIIDVLRQAEGPIPTVDLPERIPGSDPNAVRSVSDKLIANLVLVEDLQPGTFDIVVGFFPGVREGLIRASRPPEQPPLIVCENPREMGPEGSVIAGDLRAFLLEVASEPPRLRQDGDLFQKEVDRFQTGLEPLPVWLMGLLKWSDEARLSQALGWARALELVADVAEGSQIRLQLTAAGHRWLSSGIDDQYARMYGAVNAVKNQGSIYTRPLRLFATGPDSYGTSYDDSRFLGESILALKLRKGDDPEYWEVKSQDIRALRASVDQALAALEPGVFYRLDSIGPHLAFGANNPVNCGLAPEQVAVFERGRMIPPLEELREGVGRDLIEAIVVRRLIPLGGVRTAVDTDGRICVARERRLDAYFGRKVDATEMAPAADTAAKVVVQPDFSVIIIGLNPAAAAELAPFCERTTRGGGQGALILKITRDSVVKAVSHGMKPGEITDRLRRHASNEVPANVLREVQDWSSWVRQVIPSTLTVLRCPDRDTADRVMSVFKRQAERVSETLVAIEPKTLTAAEKNKLRAHGIIVQGNTQTGAVRPKARRW